MEEQVILLDASVSRRKLPENIIDDEIALFSGSLEKFIEETKLLTLRGVRACDEGILFKGFNVMYEESFHEDYLLGINSLSTLARFKSYLEFLKENYLLAKTVNIEGNCLWITDNNSTGYYHWLSDAIPRLVAAMQVIEKPKLILPSRFKHFDNIAFVEESLKVFPISDVTYIERGEVCSMPQLFYPTYVAQSGNYNDDLIKQVRAKYRHYYTDKSGLDLGDKIYVSRANARRKILNEKAVIDLLSKYGFKPVSFEEHSFHEQVSIVLNAKYIVSNHGAGLTNMLFMEAGSSALELRLKGDRFNNCFFTLACALDIKYYYQTCMTESGVDGEKFSQITFSQGSGYTLEQFNEWRAFTNSNMIVDLERLKININRMLGSI